MALSQAVRHLTDELREAHLDRMQGMATLRSDAARHRMDMRHALGEMAGALARDFGDASAARRAAEGTRRAETTRAARQRDAHLDGVRGSVASMRSSVASTRAAMASTLAHMRADVQDAHRAWSEFAAFARSATAPAAAPSAGAQTRTGEATAEKVLELLGERPTGMRLGELQKALELPRRQVARQMDELVASRKVKLDKQGVYFSRH